MADLRKSSVLANEAKSKVAKNNEKHHDCDLCSYQGKFVLTLSQSLECTPHYDPNGHQSASEYSSARIKCLKPMFKSFLNKVKAMVIDKDEMVCENCFKGMPVFKAQIHRPNSPHKPVVSVPLRVDLDRDVHTLKSSWLEFVKASQKAEYSGIESLFKKLSSKNE